MKKAALFSRALLLAAILAGSAMARAAEPQPALAGDYAITYTLAGGTLWPHLYTITSINPATGEFTGTGHFLPDPSYTEIITGKFDGTLFTFHILYTGTNAGYTVDAIGTIDANGQLAGTATSPGQQFTWTCSRTFTPQVPPPACNAWWNKLSDFVQNALQHCHRPDSPDPSDSD